MRNWINLVEMPLAGIEHHGDWSSDEHSDDPIGSEEINSEFELNANNSFLSKFDRRLATNPRLLDRLTKSFSRHDTTFYLYFFNDPRMEYFIKNLDYGDLDNAVSLTRDERNPEIAKSVLGQALVDTIEKRRKPGVIQIILTHNEGGDKRHPLTPWMIAHRMVHAMIGTDGLHLGASTRGLNAFTMIAHRCYKLPSRDLSMAYYERELAMVLAKKVCTFKAAREDNILNDQFFELYCEMVTQYLMTGKIGRNPLPKVAELRGTKATLKNPELAEDLLDAAFEDINDSIQRLFEGRDGKILIC